MVPVLNNYRLAAAAIASLKRNRAAPDTEIIALNNGSTEGELKLPGVRVVNLPENIGNYPVFALCPDLVSAQCDVLAVFHSGPVRPRIGLRPSHQ